jgi:hypothetical protein
MGFDCHSFGKRGFRFGIELSSFFLFSFFNIKFKFSDVSIFDVPLNLI